GNDKPEGPPGRARVRSPTRTRQKPGRSEGPESGQTRRQPIGCERKLTRAVGRCQYRFVDDKRSRTTPRVGRQVRHWRQERGLTLSQLADGSGLNVGYLSQIENDKAAPSLEALGAMADAMDVPAAWFLIDSS